MLCLIRFCNPLAIVGAAAVALFASEALPQEPPGQNTRAFSDHRWLSGTATAALVLEPPRLKHAHRWTIESRRHRGVIRASAQSPDGTRLATGGIDGTVRIWNIETGVLDRAITAHRFGIISVAWSPDGEKMATVAGPGEPVRIWDEATGKLLAEPPSNGHLYSLEWSPDSRRLAAIRSGEQSGCVYVSDAHGEFKSVKKEGSQVVAVAWSRDGGLLAYALAGGTVNVVETAGWNFKYAIELPNSEAARALAWSPDGRMLATAGLTGAAAWKSDTGTEASHTDGGFTAIAWAPDSRRFLAAATRGVFVNPADGKSGPAFADGGRLHWNAKTGRITAVSADAIRVWEPEGTEPVVAIDAGGTHSPLFHAGRPVITGIGSKELTAWDSTTFRRLAVLKGHTGPVLAAAWSRDGERLATGGVDGTVRIWNTNRGEQLHSLAGHKGSVTAIAWAPDGDLLASAGVDKTVRVWPGDGQEMQVLAEYGGIVLTLAWAPKGRLLASGGRDKKLVIMKPHTGEHVRTIKCAAWPVAIDWANVKGLSAIACGMQDGSATIFNGTTGATIASVIEGSPSWPYGFGGIAWASGGRPTIFTSRWYLTQAWDVAKKDSTAMQIAPGGGFSVVSADAGKVVVVRAADRTTRLWEPSSSRLRDVLLDESGVLVAISADGDVVFDPEVPPALIAIVEAADGHQTMMSLDEFESAYGWKGNRKAFTLPIKN